METLLEVLVPISLFAMIAAIVIIPRYFQSQERQRLQDTVRAAVEKGQSLPPEVIDAITSNAKPKASPERDLRTGLIWLGVAVGFGMMGYFIGMEEPDATYPMLGLAAFPAFIGVAFIVISLLGRGRK